MAYGRGGRLAAELSATAIARRIVARRGDRRRLPGLSGGGGSGRPSCFAKNVSSACLRDRRGVRAVLAVLGEDRRRQSAGCRAARRTRTSRGRADRASSCPAAARPPSSEITCAVPVLPDDVVARRSARGRRCRRRSPPSTGRRGSPAAFSGFIVDRRLRRRRRHRLPAAAHRRPPSAGAASRACRRWRASPS